MPALSNCIANARGSADGSLRARWGDSYLCLGRPYRTERVRTVKANWPPINWRP